MGQFFVDYGGLIATVVGSLLSTLVSLSVWMINRLLARIDVLESSFASFREESTNAHTALALEVKVAGANAEAVGKSLRRTEGRIDEQQKTIITLIEKIAMATAKLEAVFRFIDARKRSTDEVS